MILEVWVILPNEITCANFGPHKKLLVYLSSLENTDSLKGNIEGKVSIEHIPELESDPDDLDEAEGIIVDIF